MGELVYIFSGNKVSEKKLSLVAMPIVASNAGKKSVLVYSTGKVAVGTGVKSIASERKQWC